MAKNFIKRENAQKIVRSEVNVEFGALAVLGGVFCNGVNRIVHAAEIELLRSRAKGQFRARFPQNGLGRRAFLGARISFLESAISIPHWQIDHTMQVLSFNKGPQV